MQECETKRRRYYRTLFYLLHGNRITLPCNRRGFPTDRQIVNPVGTTDGRSLDTAQYVSRAQQPTFDVFRLNICPWSFAPIKSHLFLNMYRLQTHLSIYRWVAYNRMP